MSEDINLENIEDSEKSDVIVEQPDIPVFHFEIVDMNKAVTIDIGTSIGMLLNQHNNSIDSHPNLFDEIHQVSSFALNKAAELSLEMDELNAQYGLLSDRIDQNCLGSSEQSFYVANPEESLHAVNKGYVDANFVSMGDLNQLNTIKANINLSNIAENLDVVVDSYKSGLNWYRKYKSGWIEQGGYAQTSSSNRRINFSTPFAVNSYFMCAVTDLATTSSSANNFPNSGKTATYATLYQWATNSSGSTETYRPVNWFACGY